MSENSIEYVFDPVTGGPDIMRYYYGGSFSRHPYKVTVDSHSISYAFALSVGVRLARNK